MKKLFWKITGGRPMILLDKEGFWDHCGSKRVNYYRDRHHNRVWMATGKWAMFRVESPSMKKDYLASREKGATND